MSDERITIYTDGACSGNPGPGGWAAILIFKGVEREMTVVFTDLAGFTALSERLGRDIVPLLNEFMGEATKVIKRHHGFVNKFLGDGILFFFNAPRPNATYVRTTAGPLGRPVPCCARCSPESPAYAHTSR